MAVKKDLVSLQTEECAHLKFNLIESRLLTLTNNNKTKLSNELFRNEPFLLMQ